MPVDRVIAKIRFASDEPFRKGRLTKITNRVERSLPMNRLGLFGPEAFRLFQRTATELDRSSGRTHFRGEEQVTAVNVTENRKQN